MLSGDENGLMPTNYSPDMVSNMTFSTITSVDKKVTIFFICTKNYYTVLR